MLELTFPTDLLRAVAVAMHQPGVEKRHLQGVRVEYNGEQVRLIATDGVMLLAAQNPTQGGAGDPVASTFTIPRDVVLQALATDAETTALAFYTENDFILGNAMGSVLDEEFPNWRRVIPIYHDLYEKVAQFSPEYQVKAHEAGLYIGSPFVSLHPGVRAGSTALLQFHGNEYRMGGVLMPRRLDHEEYVKSWMEK